jgi:hypothetical protein
MTRLLFWALLIFNIFVFNYVDSHSKAQILKAASEIPAKAQELYRQGEGIVKTISISIDQLNAQQQYKDSLYRKVY